MTAFVQGSAQGSAQGCDPRQDDEHGGHEYLVPVLPGRGPDGLGRATTYDWPDGAREISPERLRHEHVDAVVLQRPHELELAERWLGRRIGRGVPAFYVEHNTPKGNVPQTRHPMADRDDLVIVHVTHFNDLFWDCGGTRTVVIEHGVPDPGHRYSGELPHLAAVINEPVRRTRVAGTDLLPRFARVAPVDVFGMKTSLLPAALPDLAPDTPGRPHVPGPVNAYDLPQAAMHQELARRRVYVHPYRWTSLGLSLLEAMFLGMPVVVLASTEAVAAVPPEAGALTTRVDVLVETARSLIADPEAAAHAGKVARAAAIERYALRRFLQDWDRLLQEVDR